MAGRYDMMYDYQSPVQSFMGDQVLTEIHHLKEQVKSVEEKQTEQEYWKKLLDSNIRSGTVACMWCIRAQITKRLSLAFYKWKYTSMLMNPTTSRKATPLKSRTTSSTSDQVQPGHLSVVLENALHVVSQTKAANHASPAAASLPPPPPAAAVHSASAPVPPPVPAVVEQPAAAAAAASPPFKAIERPQSRQSIVSSVMEIQYNPASSAHLNKYLQDTLVNKDTDFDTKRKILLAMSNDIIDRGRSSRTPDRRSAAATPTHLQDIPDAASVHSVAASRLSLSSIRSDLHPPQHSFPPGASQLAASSTAVVDHHHYHTHHDGVWSDQRSPLHSLARSSGGFAQGQSPRATPHGLTLDMANVDRSRSQSAGGSSARGHAFGRSPARGRWNEEWAPGARQPAEFKYLVFKNNDAGNYVRELIASPTFSPRSNSANSRPRSASANRTGRTPTHSRESAAVHHSGGENSSVTAGSIGSSMRRNTDQPASSGSVNSRHEVRHRINNLDTSRTSAASGTSSSSTVPRFMLPTNSYIKKILSPQEAAQFSISGHHLSGGMRHPANSWKPSPGQQMRSPEKGYFTSPQHDQPHQPNPQREQSRDHPTYSPTDHGREHHEHAPEGEPETTAPSQLVAELPRDTETSATAASAPAAVKPTSEPSPVPARPSEPAQRTIRQPHFVTGAVESLSGRAHHYPTPYAPAGHGQHQSADLNLFYSTLHHQPVHPPPTVHHQELLQQEAHWRHQQQQLMHSPHLQEYADLIYSTPSLDPLLQQLVDQGHQPPGRSAAPQQQHQQRPQQPPAAAPQASGGLYSSYADGRNESGAAQYGHSEYDHSEGDYNPAYHNPHFPSSGAEAGSYWDEGPVDTSRYSNASYQSYQQQQRQQGRKALGTAAKKSSGASTASSKGRVPNSGGKKTIDPAQARLFYGHLADTRDPKASWTRTLRN